MPGSPNISQKSMKPNPGITIKKEPSSPPKKDVKTSLENLRLGSNRLPSFRPKRDLTLSSMASSSSLQTQSRPKRTFAPNIPVRREKGDKIIESRSENLSKKVPNIVKQERGKGRNRGKEREFIQTKGSLFGEGIAASGHVKRNSDYGGFGGAREGKGGTKPSEMRMPVLNPDAASSVDREYEESILKGIKGDNTINDSDEEVEQDAPRSLPLVKCEDIKKNIKNDSFKMEDSSDGFSRSGDNNKRIKIKEEPGLDKEEESDKYGFQFSGEKYNFPKDSVAYSLLTKTEKEFIQLQFPPCLPAYAAEEPLQSGLSNGSSGSEVRHDHDSNSSVNSGLISSILSSKPRCTLDTLPEGQIGNLRIYESGKVELCLGDHVLDINKGVPVGYLQDSVNITVDSESKTGSMTVLGHFKDRFVVTPDLEKIVKNMKNSKL